MARKTKNPPSETDILLTNYIDQTLANIGKIGWSSEEVSGMVQEVMKCFLERLTEETDRNPFLAPINRHIKNFFHAGFRRLFLFVLWRGNLS